MYDNGHATATFDTAEAVATYRQVTGPHLLKSENQFLEIAKVVDGLYVMVRGLDNIGKGLAGTTYESKWKKVFRD